MIGNRFEEYSLHRLLCEVERPGFLPSPSAPRSLTAYSRFEQTFWCQCENLLQTTMKPVGTHSKESGIRSSDRSLRTGKGSAFAVRFLHCFSSGRCSGLLISLHDNVTYDSNNQQRNHSSVIPKTETQKSKLTPQKHEFSPQNKNWICWTLSGSLKFRWI